MLLEFTVKAAKGAQVEQIEALQKKLSETREGKCRRREKS